MVVHFDSVGFLLHGYPRSNEIIRVNYRENVQQEISRAQATSLLGRAGSFPEYKFSFIAIHHVV